MDPSAGQRQLFPIEPRSMRGNGTFRRPTHMFAYGLAKDVCRATGGLTELKMTQWIR